MGWGVSWDVKGPETVTVHESLVELWFVSGVVSKYVSESTSNG